MSEEQPLTAAQKLARLWTSVFGEKIGDTHEPGILTRLRRVEKKLPWILLASAIAAAQAIGIPTESLGKSLLSLFAGIAEAAGLHPPHH